MPRFLLSVVTLMAWASVFTTFSNPIPFASVSLLALIAIANVYDSTQRKYNLAVNSLLVTTLLLASTLFSLILIGDVMNSFSIYGVDVTISIASLLSATGWVIRASLASCTQAQHESPIIVIAK